MRADDERQDASGLDAAPRGGSSAGGAAAGIARVAVPASLRERGIEDAVAWAIPMTTRFRRLEVRDGLLLRGPMGWSEFSPFWDYDARESAAWLRAAVEDATAQRPPAVRAEVPVNATIPVVAPERAREIAVAQGARTAKIKIADPGSTLEEDLARVAAVREAMGPDARLRVDANAAYSFAEAVEALPLLDRAAGGLEYAEQPVASLEDMVRLRRAVDVPLAADELVRRADDPLRVARAGAADVLVMKVQPLGGIRRCLALAADAGLPVVVSSALESSIGLSAGAAFAAALPELAHACGLGTGALLTADLASDPVLARDGAIDARRREPKTALLARCAADDRLARRWERRLRECAGPLPRA